MVEKSTKCGSANTFVQGIKRKVVLKKEKRVCPAELLDQQRWGTYLSRGVVKGGSIRRTALRGEFLRSVLIGKSGEVDRLGRY